MRRRPYAGMGIGDLVLVGLEIIDQAFEVVGVEILAPDNDHRNFRDEPDIFERLERLVGELAIECRRGRHAYMVEQQGVAVGRRLGDPAGPERAAGSRHILHHDLLAEILAHRFRHQPGHRVGRATRREWHDDGDRPVRIV